MKAFAETWADEQILQQVVAKLPWGHNVRLIERVKDPGERLWYAEQTLANGWSRNVLVLQIETGLYRRQGKAITNFDRTLPPAQSDLAQQITKDPYNFDFLVLASDAHERDLGGILGEAGAPVTGAGKNQTIRNRAIGAWRAKSRKNAKIANGGNTEAN